MAQSLNTKVDFTTAGIAYLGFAEYGKIMIGDRAFEFFNDTNVEKNMQFPWASIKRVEGDVSVSKNGKVKIGRQFIIVFRNEQKVRFAAKESGTVLKYIRQYIGNEKVVRQKGFFDKLFSLFRRKKK